MNEIHSGLGRRDFMRRAAAAGFFIGVPSLLAACGSDDKSSSEPDAAPGAGGASPLKIGELLDLSGPLGAVGEDIQAGFAVYLGFNDGKLGGRKIEVMTEDDEGNPDIAQRKARRLVEEIGVPIVTGLVSSSVALAVRDYFDERKVPVVVSNAAADALTRDLRSDYIYRVATSAYQVPYGSAEWVYENVGQNVFVSVPDYAAGTAIGDAFVQGFEEAGGTIAGRQLTPPFGAARDYQPFLSEIQASDADVVFAFYAGADAINFVRQYDDFGLKDRLPLVGYAAVEEEVLHEQGDSALGVLSQSHYAHSLDNPENIRFVEAYKERTGRNPSAYSVQGYDAAQFIDLALQATDGSADDGALLAAEMGKIVKFPSPRGEAFEMDPATHNAVNPVYMLRVEDVDGELVNTVLAEVGVARDPG